MIFPAELALAFMAGLAGSAHCLGMCGGFAVAAGATGDLKRAIRHQAAYHTGKSVTYAVLGGVAGAAGGLVSGAVSSQHAVAVLAGCLLVAFGLGQIGWLPFVDRLLTGRSFTAVVNGLKAFLPPRTTQTAFGLGLFNGLLPCGLVYAVVVGAAGTGSFVRGALFMAAFGLGTAPALVALGFAGRAMAPGFTRRMSRVGGILVIALGLLTIVRSGAVPGIDAAHIGHSATPSVRAPSENH